MSKQSPSTLQMLRSLLKEKRPTREGKEVRQNLKLSGIFLLVGFAVSLTLQFVSLPEPLTAALVMFPVYVAVKLFVGVFKTASETAYRQSVRG